METRSMRKKRRRNRVIVTAVVIYSLVLMFGVYTGYTIKDATCKSVHSEDNK